MKSLRLLAGVAVLCAACSPQPDPNGGSVVVGAAPGAMTAYNFARAIAVGGDGTLSVVWHDGEGTGAGSIWYARSIDGGATWESARMADYEAAAGQASVAAAGAAVIVAWHDHAGPAGIYVARSDDFGASFSAPILVVEGRAAHPSLGRDGDRVVMAWGDHRDGAHAEIYAAASEDGGATWSSAVRVSEVPYESWVPAVAVSRDMAYVAWVDYRDGNEEEYIALSDDGGSTWSSPRRLTVDGADSWAPTVAARGDTVHLAWFDRRHAGATEIDVETELDDALRAVGVEPEPIPERDPADYYLPLFRERTEAKRLQLQTALPEHVQSGGDAGLLEANLRRVEELTRAWESGWEIFYQRSDDGGGTWTDPVRLTTSETPSLRPSLAVTDESVVIVWFQGRADGSFDVMLEESSDGGNTWDGPRAVATGDGDHRRPSVALFGGAAHVVWVDVEADRVLHSVCSLQT